MDKIAQKRSLLNKIKEFSNVGGRATETFFNPEFKDIMDKLRNETDDPVRAIVSGDKIGEADAPSDGASLKQLLSDAKSNLNRREYMKAIADLSRFHKKMQDVVTILNKFDNNVSSAHEKFLFKDLDDESKKHLHDLQTRFAANKNLLVKEAGLLDLLSNIGTTRGRALSAWEKRYPAQVKKLKEDTKTIFTKALTLFNKTLNALKDMAAHRAARKIDEYSTASKIIVKEFNSFHNLFKTYYDQNVKNFLEKQQLVDLQPETTEVAQPQVTKDIAVQTSGPLPSIAPISEKTPTLQTSPESIKSLPSIDLPIESIKAPQEQAPEEYGLRDLEQHDLSSSQQFDLGDKINPISVAPISKPLSIQPTEVSLKNLDSGKIDSLDDVAPTWKAPTTEKVPSTAREVAPTLLSEDETNRTPKNIKVEQGFAVDPTHQDTIPETNKDGDIEVKDHFVAEKKSLHQNFINSLESMSNESPLILKLYISKYAKLIENKDPQASNQLKKLAKSF